MSEIEIKVHSRMDQIETDAWNRLLQDNNPFLRHEFLAALESHQCVSKQFGWIPQHIGLYLDGQLLAAMPLYEKHNNYGEFVFDQAWSDAWQQVGLNYYPKLVSAIPYSPVLGQRLLILPTLDSLQQQQLSRLLIDAVKELCQHYQMSGFHLLFAEAKQQKWLSEQPELLYRQDCQFHWFNQNYQNFNDFLASLTAKKRKNIKQERKSVQQAGISFRLLNGHSATPADWIQFEVFYQKTFLEKWGTPTLNRGFFESVAKALPDQVLLVLADNSDGECIAGSLMFLSDTHLYGRHWGATQTIKNLHFEACFYQGIEFAIQQGLQVFEPGAGGEHKIARGFVPVAMQSAHWLKENPFPEGVDQFIAMEKQGVEEYMQESLQRSPYRENNAFYQDISLFKPNSISVKPSFKLNIINTFKNN